MKSNTAENGKLQYEAGQDSTPMSALTDSGDHLNYTSTPTLWSDRAGYSPVVRPDGLPRPALHDRASVDPGHPDSRPGDDPGRQDAVPCRPAGHRQ